MKGSDSEHDACEAKSSATWSIISRFDGVTSSSGLIPFTLNFTSTFPIRILLPRND
jgi:hypothetical protein